MPPAPLSGEVPDPVLDPFLNAPIDSTAEHDALSVLIDEVTPVIEGVIRGRAGATIAPIEREELFSDAVLQLIRKLREIKSNPPRQAIGNFHGYAAVTTFNVVHAHFRRANPERQRLRNRIRHVIRTSPRFALWQSAMSQFVGGYATWADAAPGEPTEAELDRIPALSPAPAVSWSDSIGANQITRSLEHVFSRTQKPVELERLVEKIAELFRLPVLASQMAPAERVDEEPSIESALVYRSALSEVWREIDELPARQRVALLLGLRDENGSAMMSLLVVLRIATFDELAAAVELGAADLAAIWDQLPLADILIAERLGLTRQQVINLRKSARDRLGRRLTFLRDGNPLLGRASSSK